MSKNCPLLEFCTQVVRNVASPHLQVRKPFYIYISLCYAEGEPNRFQKDLTEINLLIRAMNLRVLSGMRISVIGGSR
jgi:AP-3 complex subunit beta